MRTKRKLFIYFSSIAFTALLIFFINNSSSFKAKLSDDCLVCHEDKDLTMEKNGKKISLYVNPAKYKGSKHGGFDCKDCHEGYNPDNIPHSTSKKEIDCLTCHDNVKISETNVHKSNKCYSCHNPHETKPAAELKKNQTEICLDCHKSKSIQQYQKTIHAKKNVGCDGCHNGGHEVVKLKGSNASAVCSKCHKQHSQMQNSIHNTVLRQGNKNAPDCIDCHGSHNLVIEKLTIESKACLKCHLDEKLFPGDGKGSAEFVKNYKMSVHSSIQKDGKPAASCVDCHGDHMIEKVSDPQQSSARARLIETCGKCHNSQTEHFKTSAHGIAFNEGNKEAPTCFTCHGEHGIKAVRSTDDFSKINETEICLNCHKNDKVNKNKNTHLDDYKNSFHYIALKNGNTKAATCADCHGAHEMKLASDTTSNIYKKNVDKTCGQSGCHITQYQEYKGSIHQVSLIEKGNFDSPNCVDCHGNHQIVEPDSLGKIEGSKQRGIIKLCTGCHASVELIQNNNLPNVAGTYLESFHGLAVRGGSKQAADCGSCHGNHNIRPSSDTLSTIHKNNLGKTCGKCHPGASEVFINSRIHILEAKTENPMLFWVTRFYIILIVGTIGLMLLHNILDLRKKLKAKKAGK